MKSPLLILLLLISMSQACSDTEGLLWNIFQNPGLFSPGITDTVAPAERVLLTTYNNFGTFDKTLTVFDNGGICNGDCTARTGNHPYPAISATVHYIAGVWIEVTTPDVEMRYEVKQFLRQNQMDDGVAISANECYFEAVDQRLMPYIDNVTSEELLIVTWDFNSTNSVRILSQVVLAYTSDGSSFALINFLSTDVLDVFDPFGIIGFVNFVNSTPSDPAFATACGPDIYNDLLRLSNNICGRPGQIVFNLNGPCTDADVCDNLSPDPEARNMNCRDLVEPLVDCGAVTGFCRPSNNSFIFDFAFTKELAEFGNFEVVNDTGLPGDALCTLTSIDNGTFYSVIQEVDQNFIDTCGVLEDAGTYYFHIHNYADSNLVFQRGSNVFNISCKPDSLLAELNVGDIVKETKTVNSPLLKLMFGNMLDVNSTDFVEFGPSAPALVGTPIFPVIGYTSPDNFGPYGVYVIDCDIGNREDFSDRIVKVIENGCPVPGVYAFGIARSFKYTDNQLPQFEFTISAGPFRAARWISDLSIWMRCLVDVCIRQDFEESLCRDSCNGTGVNHDEGLRKKRQFSNPSTVLTGHLSIIDKDDDIDGRANESQLSCANERLAYATIAIMVTLLFVATVITTLLFLKVRERKLK